MWNYRVVYRSGEEECPYRIHEVYYDDNGRPEAWTENAVTPMGESLGELRNDCRYFLDAFRLPVLEEREVDGKPRLVPRDAGIGPGHHFELMDRALVALGYLQDALGDHPVTRRDRELSRLFSGIGEMMGEFYARAGALWHEHEGDEDG